MLKTVVPLIRSSLRKHGVLASFARSFLLPAYLLREYRLAWTLAPDNSRSDFDRTHGVNTDGMFQGRIFLSDLDIPSPNWIEGGSYIPIVPERFERMIQSLNIEHEKYTFIDFGSGKGRALLLASKYPFKKVLGLEFSPELHRIAQENIRRYRSETQKCNDLQSINIDFVDFELPPEPLVLYFYDPCRRHLLSRVLARIHQSVLASPRPLHIAFAAPQPEYEELFAACGFAKKVQGRSEDDFIIYSSVGAAHEHLPHLLQARRTLSGDVGRSLVPPS